MKRLYRIAKRVLVIVVSLALLLALTALCYMQQPGFGKKPAGARLERIKQSPNYKDGQFRNLSETPTFAEGYGFWSELYKAIFTKKMRARPEGPIPSVKSDLLHLPPDAEVLVWFGHSSCFLQVGGKTILVDPVFSGNVSPIGGNGKSFKGSDIYSVDDLPGIDYLLISHDHYDHLDYETVVALEKKTKQVICGLGVGEDLEYWGYPVEKIVEKDWYGSVVVDSGFTIYIEPARHKSGRALAQNKTLWVSFLIQAPGQTIYISGDGGYDNHFAAIGDRYGPIDLAILENGQYDSAWHYVHCLPSKVLMAARDLKARRLFPYHSSKFALAKHAWDEPLSKITALDTAPAIRLVTPMIGEIVRLNDTAQSFKQWWTGIQ